MPTGRWRQRGLRASHIKPWKDSTDSERLDKFNGLLLAPHIDAAFDRGFITFEDDGRLVVASALDEDAQQMLALNKVKKTVPFDERHLPYLRYHREHVFLGQ